MEAISENGGVADDAVSRISDEAIVRRLRELLETVDLGTTTTRALREMLQSDLGVDMSDKKDLIKEGVQAFLDEKNAKDEDEAGGAGSDVKEEEGEEEGEEDEGEEEGEESSESEEEEKVATKKEEDGDGKPKRGGVFNRPCQLSPALAAFIGVESMSRGQVVKQMWEYIREHGLQNPKDKRVILCDERMQTVFPPTVTMFSMNKHLAKHMTYAGAPGAGGGGAKAPKVAKRKAKYESESDGEESEEEEDEEDDDDGDDDDDEEDEEEDEPKPSKKRKASPPPKSKPSKEKEKPKKPKKDTAASSTAKAVTTKAFPSSSRPDKKKSASPVPSSSPFPRAAKKEKKPRVSKPKSRGSDDDGEDAPKRATGFTKPHRCSPELVEFLDGREQIPRPELVKHIWTYVKEHSLQKEDDKSVIVCDDKLQALFHVASFKGFGMMKYLKKHLYPIESD